jgi:hypothetical protein
MTIMLDVTIPRDVKVTLYNFTDHFKGFEKVSIVKEIFGDNTQKVLNELKVEFCHFRRGFMWICDDDGHLVVSVCYLKRGNERDIYLDVIHELVHVRQFMEGEELYNDHIDYVERPTEIEAYEFTLREARRIGMTDAEIFEYLKTDWISEDEEKKLAKTLGVKISE